MKNYQFHLIFEDNTEITETFSFTSPKKAINWIQDFKTDKKLKSWHIFEYDGLFRKNIKNWYNQTYFPF